MTYEACNEKGDPMIFDARRHKGRLDHDHSDKGPKKSPCCNKNITDLNSCSVPVPEEVRNRSWKLMQQVPRNIWEEMFVNINVPVLSLRHMHLYPAACPQEEADSEKKRSGW